MHLTLVFLGDVDDRALEHLQAALSVIVHQYEPFPLEIEAPGTFPPQRPARVAWIGIERTEALSALQADLEAATGSALERTLDSRPYHPHLTVARCREPWPRWAIEHWSTAESPCAGRSFEVTYVDLMQSRLTPSGPLYDRLQRLTLEA